MEFKVDLDDFEKLDNLKIDTIKLQKMILLYSSIEEGWTVKKQNNSYVFTKCHENNIEIKKEFLDDMYLLTFMKNNLDINKIFN